VRLAAKDLDRQPGILRDSPGGGRGSVGGSVVDEEDFPVPASRPAVDPLGDSADAGLDPPALVVGGDDQRRDFGLRIANFGFGARHFGNLNHQIRNPKSEILLISFGPRTRTGTRTSWAKPWR